MAIACSTASSNTLSPFSYHTSGTLSSGQAYELTIEEGPITQRKEGPGDDGSRWGIDGGFAETCIQKFELVVDGQSLWIPRKVFEDLSYVRSANVYDYHGALRIDLKGSDAAGSFRASFLFSGWEIERLVRHGEFPNGRWEYVVEHSSVAEITDGANPPISPAKASLLPEVKPVPE